MRVLHVEAGRYLYGGALQVAYLLRGLQAQGVENLLACPLHSAMAERMGGAGRHGIRVYPMPMRGDADPGLVLRLRRLIVDERPDLVHLHSRRGADLFGLLAARWARVPAVLTRRVDNPEPAWLARRKYGLAARVIAISEGIRRVLSAQGLPAGRVECVHSAVDSGLYGKPCEREWLRSALGVEAGERAIGMIAQLIPRKGHGIALEAMAILRDRHPRARLLLFGRGPLQDWVAERIKGLGLTGVARPMGFRDDLERVLPCLDLVVHPARMEGLGVALLQAAAAGVPLVGCPVGGVPEVVRDGVNGLLVPPGDSKALAAAMERLLSDRELARRMGEAGRALVEREFSISAMVEGNLAVYRSVLADASGELQDERADGGGEAKIGIEAKGEGSGDGH